MKKLVIDRSKWRTGKEGQYSTGTGPTRLLNEDGYMCCLGFLCEQSGVARDELMDIGHPTDITPINTKTLKLLVTKTGNQTKFTEIAININDDDDMNREEREEQIKIHFASKKIEVEFINNYK